MRCGVLAIDPFQSMDRSHRSQSTAQVMGKATKGAQRCSWLRPVDRTGLSNYRGFRSVHNRKRTVRKPPFSAFRPSFYVMAGMWIMLDTAACGMLATTECAVIQTR